MRVDLCDKCMEPLFKVSCTVTTPDLEVYKLCKLCYRIIHFWMLAIELRPQGWPRELWDHTPGGSEPEPDYYANMCMTLAPAATIPRAIVVGWDVIEKERQEAKSPPSGMKK